MSNNLKLIGEKQHDDEVDLYELVDVLIRYKQTIFRTTLCIILLSFGVAFYIKSKTPEYLIKSILIKQDNYGLKEVNTIDANTILLKDKNIKKFLETENIRKEYLKNTPENMRNIASERKFLQDIIIVSKNEKNPEEISIKAKVVADELSSRDLIDTYITLLKEQDNLSQIVKKEREFKNEHLDKIKTNLDNLENKMINIFENDIDIRGLKPEEKVNYLNAKYPALILKKIEQEKYYNSYVDELVVLNSLDSKGEIIKEVTDTYVIKGQSKANLILVLGTVLGVFLGVMMAFVKEFIDNYAKRYRNN